MSEFAWKPRRVLITVDHIAGLRDYLAELRPDLELRVVARRQVTSEDLAWADTYLGFRRPRVEDWGEVRWVHSIGAGVDGFAFRPALPPHIRLTKSPEDFGPAIGEWCVARALVVNQQVLALAAAQRQHHWDRRLDPVRLAGQRALVIGTGQVGRGIACAFRALGCRVDGISRGGRPAADFDQVGVLDEFPRRVAEAAWLVLAAPLTEATYHLLDRDRLAQCAGTYLMNVGRGALVDESALPEALDHNWIRGAALDVFEREPLPDSSPLWNRPDVMVSPHNSGPSQVAATADGFLECLQAFERGTTPKWLVLPDRGY